MKLLEPSHGIDLEATIASFGQTAEGMQKDKHDLWRYQWIIGRTLPDLVIETGTDTGHSAAALFYSSSVSSVITIDVDPSRRTWPKEHRITFLTGSSTSPEIIEQVKELSEGYERIMVSLDSDHSTEHVKREIELYAPFVSPGQYLVIEDAIFDFLPEGFDKGLNANAGVLAAISEVMPTMPDFERDIVVEDLYDITGSPAGWWRRKL